MQFYDFLKQLIGYIPDSSGVVKIMFGAFLPYFLMACALFTAFFALKCATWWCCLTFFLLGSGAASQLLLPKYDVYDFEFWLFFGVAVAIGIVCAALSKYLFRVQLAVSTYLSVLAALPAFVAQIGKPLAVTVSVVASLAFVFLFVKYRYLITIATTSFSGAFVFMDVADSMVGIKLKTLWAVLLGVFALFFQILLNHDMLEDTYLDVRKKVIKTGKGMVRAEEAIAARHRQAEALPAEEQASPDALTIAEQQTNEDKAE